MKAKRQEPPKRMITSTETPTTTVEMNKSKPSPVKAPAPPPPLIEPVTVLRRMDFDQKRPKTALVNTHNSIKMNCPNTDKEMAAKKIAPVGGGGVEGGRITLQDRLRSLTGEQVKMLLDGQQRKVANKRF